MPAPERKLYRVTLLIESPDSLTHPNEWDWNLVVNPDGTKPQHKAPVILYHATEAEVGRA